MDPFGAVVDAFRLFLERRDRKARLKVTLSVGFLSQGGATSPAMLILEAANSGQIPVNLTSIPSLLLSDGQQAILLFAVMEHNLPYTLMPGTNCHVWKDMRRLAGELHDNGYSGTVLIQGRFRDAIGNSYVSKPFSFNIDGWTGSS